MKNKEMLLERSRKANLETKEQLSKLPKESVLYKANKGFIENDDRDFGIGCGVMEIAGCVVYEIGVTIFLGNLKSASFIEFADLNIGLDFDFSAVELMGHFLIDPKDMAGKCYYKIIGIDVDAGVCELRLYSKKHGTHYGTFTGISEGIGAIDVSGKATIAVQGF